MTGHKTAQAAPASSGLRSDAGFFFSGWCREGYWSRGVLLKGKEARAVNLDKFLCQAPYKRAQATQSAHRYSPAHQAAARALEPINVLGIEIPVFSEIR